MFVQYSPCDPSPVRHSVLYDIPWNRLQITHPTDPNKEIYEHRTPVVPVNIGIILHLIIRKRVVVVVPSETPVIVTPLRQQIFHIHIHINF